MLIPKAFGAPRVARALNIAGVGLALAAGTSAIFAALGSEFHGIATGLPTLVVGALWAWVLRVPATIARTKLRWAWLASVPLAAANGALAAGTMFGLSSQREPLEGFLMGCMLGATFGVFFWGPALVATLMLFGAPIAWGQHLASRGLAGEERGERVVAIACAILSALALALSFHHAPIPPEVQPPLAFDFTDRHGLFAAGIVLTRVLGSLGLVAGDVAAGLAHARELKRRAFVRSVEAGEVRGFRVDPLPEGKVLVRVSSQGEGYRVANFTEEIYLLDEEGRATEARALELPRS